MAENLERLQEAVETEVERDRQRIISDAETRAQAIRQQAESEAEALTARMVREAEEEAERLRQEVIGAGRLEAQGLRTRRRESLLDRVFEQAARRLQMPEAFDDYEAMIERLTEDAARHLRGKEALIVLADPRAREILDAEMLARLGQTLDTELLLGESLVEGQGIGVVVQTPDGRLRYDNRLEARLRRMRSTLRPAIYRILMGGEA